MKLIFFFVSVLFYCSLYSQVVDSSAIVGKWIFSKYTLTKNCLPVDQKVGSGAFSYFQFFSNGTYQEIEKDKTSQFITKGKWRIFQENKLHLFNNVDVPDDPQVEIGDHDMEIKLISDQLYILYTYGDVKFGPETDYYKKK